MVEKEERENQKIKGGNKAVSMKHILNKKESISIGLLVICYLPAAFYGIDTGMGWIGFLKMLTVLFFLCCAMQLTEEEKEKLLGKVPLIGCILLVGKLEKTEKRGVKIRGILSF